MRTVLARLRPSPSMAVAFLALLVAIGGTAAALPGKNTVTSDDIAKGAVKNSDIGRGAVTAKSIRRRSLDGTDIKINRVGGNAVKEEVLELNKLGKVPTAAAADTANTANSANSANTANRANSAAASDQVKGFRYAAASGSATEEVILQHAGLVLTANCDTDDPDLIATTTVDNSVLTVWTFQDGDNDLSLDFDSGAANGIDVELGHSQGTGTDLYELYYSNPNGTDLRASYQIVEDGSGPVFPGTPAQADCLISGVSIAD